MDVNMQGLSKRSDADIARSAENVLQWTSYLHKDAAKVMVEKGWITLSGEVDWEYQRAAATNAVRHLLGVTGVSNQMGIKPAASSTIKTNIETALKRRARSDIDVSVDGSSVTLTGTVDSWALRDLASHAAWGTHGVDAVMNRIAVAY
jgi:osmotically-inducible protein OsmY